jgi:hypothetical protein
MDPRDKPEDDALGDGPGFCPIRQGCKLGSAFGAAPHPDPLPLRTGRGRVEIASCMGTAPHRHSRESGNPAASPAGVACGWIPDSLAPLGFGDDGDGGKLLRRACSLSPRIAMLSACTVSVGRGRVEIASHMGTASHRHSRESGNPAASPAGVVCGWIPIASRRSASGMTAMETEGNYCGGGRVASKAGTAAAYSSSQATSLG